MLGRSLVNSFSMHKLIGRIGSSLQEREMIQRIAVSTAVCVLSTVTCLAEDVISATQSMAVEDAENALELLLAYDAILEGVFELLSGVFRVEST